MADASVVFRNEDMSSTGKIYVNTMEGAGALAAQYRNAAYFVDVIDRTDVVAHRWERGNPEWEESDVLYFHRGFAPYDFERKGDAWWDPENRASELSDMLAFAFDVALGNQKATSEYCPIRCSADADWTLEELVDEADEIRASTPTDDAETWAMAISDWMSDPDRLCVKYHVEYFALLIRFGLAIPDCRVGRLGVELAEAEQDLSSRRGKTNL